MTTLYTLRLVFLVGLGVVAALLVALAVRRERSR